MFILARGGQTYARLRFNVGPGGSLQIPVEVDFGQEFAAADHAAWEQEYLQCVVDAHESLPVLDGGPAAWLDDDPDEPWGRLDAWEELFGPDATFTEEATYDEFA